jgi:hypothetical protein
MNRLLVALRRSIDDLLWAQFRPTEAVFGGCSQLLWSLT